MQCRHPFADDPLNIDMIGTNSLRTKNRASVMKWNECSRETTMKRQDSKTLINASYELIVERWVVGEDGGWA